MATRKRTKGQTTDTFTKAYILFMSAAGKNKNQIIQNKRHTDSTKNPQSTGILNSTSDKVKKEINVQNQKLTTQNPDR
jgi:response regulator of citrate/malate metabolism